MKKWFPETWLHTNHLFLFISQLFSCVSSQLWVCQKTFQPSNHILSVNFVDASRVDDTSPDLFSPGSAVGGADLQPNRISFEPLTQDPKLTIPTPQLLPFCQTNDSHLRFLRSLCGLQQLKGNSRGQEALWFGHDGEMCSVFADTMCQLLDSVVAACRPPATVGPTDLVLQACQVAAQALDLFCSQRMPSVELLSRMEEPLRELTQMLLHSKQPSRVSNGIHEGAVFACMKYLVFTVAIMTTCARKWSPLLGQYN